MREPSENHDESSASGARRGIRWDALAAIIASLVGLLALLVAGYTAYVQRQQVRAQVWPYLLMGTSDVDEQYDFDAINRGVGPAIIKGVQVLIGGKPVRNFRQLMQAIDFTPPDSGFVLTTLNRVVIAPGQQLHWIRFRSAADVDAFKLAWSRFQVEAHVCYASTLGESWMVIFRPGTIAVPKAVSSCPELPRAAQFVD